MLNITRVRIDPTVVDADIAAPSDSQLINDAVRVLSRHLAVCHRDTGLKIRFTDQRKNSKKLAFAIFYAKNSEKQALYPKLLARATVVIEQINRTTEQLETHPENGMLSRKWIATVKHYRKLLYCVIDQTQRRVYEDEAVPSSEKLVSIFEPHTDIIVKGTRNVQYGHKINLASDACGIVTHLDICKGNTADRVLYQPLLESHEKLFDELPRTTIADGGYASVENVQFARAAGVHQPAFHKRAGWVITRWA